MAEENSQVDHRAGRLTRLALRAVWGLGAVVIAATALSPILSIFWLALRPGENIWPHLTSTVLPRYLGTTLALMLGVAALTAVFGTIAAWLTTQYRFAGRGWIAAALFFPLAVPAYVGAYALVDWLDYAGVVQTSLRGVMGWTSARDYWFPEIRSLWAATIVLAAATCPYVYLLARAAFREQSGAAHEVARALGAGPVGLFLRVGLPLARPAIAAGVALAMMEALADYGTVQHFGVQTLTTGIFSTWLTAGNATGAAQIAVLMLILIAALVAVERQGRRRARHYSIGRTDRPVAPMPLKGGKAALALLFCLIPFALGFVLPVGVMLYHATLTPSGWLAPGLARALANSVAAGAIAATLAVAGALFLVSALRTTRAALPRAMLSITSLGYAVPGAVLALGLLIPLAALDHRLADAVLGLTGQDPGLLLTGTAAALVLAYVVRFFGIAQGAVESGHGRIPPNLTHAARTLGKGAGGTLRSVHLPLLGGSLATALLLVFVDCVKELPATLMLRPFNFDTLATRVFEEASLERLSSAAPAALLVSLVGLSAVVLLIRRDHR